MKQPLKVPAPLKTTTCELHGVRPWVGDFRCERCGIVYVQPERGMRIMPDVCECKAPLLPPGGGAYFSARPCCRPCALAQAPGGGEGAAV